jgi:alcohol dehydrogenase class IV
MYTPLRLWLSSGMRAVDHAIEMLYHPLSSETPHKLLSLSATHELFKLLPKCKNDPDNADIRQKLQVVAFGSLFSILFKGGLGLSHSMGHALGATYQIPHGITSCLTLAPVLRYKASTNEAEATQIARLVPFLGLKDHGSIKSNAIAVSDAVSELVERLGLKSTLTEYKVPQTQEEMQAIAERATHSKEGENYNAIIQIVKELY